MGSSIHGGRWWVRQVGFVTLAALLLLIYCTTNTDRRTVDAPREREGGSEQHPEWPTPVIGGATPPQVVLPGVRLRAKVPATVSGVR